MSTTETFARLQLAHIAPSLTNPRKTFDATKLAELAASIKASGVHQPVLVRPLPGSRVADTSTDPATGKRLAVLPTHELVAGERRYRASKLAEAADIPAMIRELTDEQVLEIQILENLQRDDLSELEEAEGYQALMTHSGLNAEQVGGKIGKSRAYVYQRLKLLDLCTDVRQALRDKKLDASTATLLARIPNAKLQIKALAEVVKGQWEGDGYASMSYRQAAAHVQRKYMLALDKATFDIKAVDLLPTAGACHSCPKRTGAEPELFSDVKSADVCTDPVCFHAKEESHSIAQAAAAQAKGLTVIAGKEAQELKTQGYYSDKVVGYRRLDSADDGFNGTTLRKLIGPLMKAQDIKPVMIESSRNKGEFLECLPNEVALKLLKQAEKAAADTEASNKANVSKEVQAMVNDKKAKQEAKAKAQFEREWRSNLVADAWVSIRDDADIKPFTTEVHRFLAIRAARNLGNEDAERVCEILNLGKVSPVSALVDFAKETAAPDMFHLLCIMQAGSSPHEHSYNGNVPNEGLMLIAGNVFTDLQQVIEEIKGEVKAKIWPEVAKKAPVATASLAQPSHAGGDKPKGAKAPAKAPAARAKLSAQEAISGIAAAMQSVDRAASAPSGAVAPPETASGNTHTFADEAAAARQLLGIGLAIGQTVRIEVGKLKGKVGEITKDLGGDVYTVKVKGRSVPTSVNMSHLTAVEGAAA